MGLDQTDIRKRHLDVYEEHPELPFLEAIKRYYLQKSEVLLAQNSVSDYLKKAEGRLTEEEDRVDRYRDEDTWKPLIGKCEHALVRRHLEPICDGSRTLFDFDRFHDLERMHAMLSRIPDGLESFKKKFEEHVKKAGLRVVSQLVGEGTRGADGLDPRAYVYALLEVRRKKSETVIRCFEGNARFVASLDSACREFVNRNAATGASTTESSELLAKYADMLLRTR